MVEINKNHKETAEFNESEIIKTVNLSFIYKSDLIREEFSQNDSHSNFKVNESDTNKTSHILSDKIEKTMDSTPNTTTETTENIQSNEIKANIDVDVNVNKQYENNIKKNKTDNRTLKEISLIIQRNKFIGLLGPTGSGKSTLVRTFNGLIPHFYSGRFFGYVYVNNIDTISSNIKTISKYVGLVFQNPENQLVTNSVEKELAFGLENLGIERDVIVKRIDEVLSYLKIEHLRKRHPYELSGGEKQRVAIASILILNPDVIILDEPTATLDPQGTLRVLNLLKKIQEEKQITVIVIEHRLEVILPYCDSIMLMRNGRIIAYGKLNEILDLDDFYNLGIEIPEYVLLLRELKKGGIINEIPTNLESAKDVLIQTLLKKELKINLKE